MSRLLGHGDVFQGDGDSLDPGLAGSGDYRRLVGGRDMDLLDSSPPRSARNMLHRRNR